MDKNDPVEAYMAESSCGRERVDHSFDSDILFLLTKQAFKSKHAMLVSTQATRYCVVQMRQFTNRIEFECNVDDAYNERARVEFTAPAPARARARDLRSAFQAMALRAAIKMGGMRKMADKIANSIVGDIARHEALMVARGVLLPPAGWSALQKREALASHAPDPRRRAKKSSSL